MYTESELMEEIDLLKKANDGLRTQMNLEAFRNRDLTRVREELLKCQQRHNAGTKAYSDMKEALRDAKEELVFLFAQNQNTKFWTEQSEARLSKINSILQTVKETI